MNLPVHTYCRLCAKLKPIEKVISLASNDENEYIEKLYRVNAPIDSFEEILPNTVCFVCIRLLEQAFEFVVQVGKAQEVLKDVFLNQEVKNEVNAFYDVDFPNVDEDITVIPEGNDVVTAVKTEELNAPKLILNDKWLDCPWLCGICGTQFTDLASLNEHSITYHGICNPYRCTDCRKRIFSIDRYVKHVSVHRKYLKKSCYLCFETFKDNLALKEHKQIHLGSKYVCRGCSKSYKSQDELKQHEEKYFSSRQVRIIPDNLIPTGLTCNECGMKAKTKASLINHLLKHTDRSRNHICEVCGKACLRKYDLNVHMLTHTEIRQFKCDICNAMFKTNYYLRIHYSLHDKVKPYTCKVCSKQFRLLKQLNFHQIVHSDTYPYKCEVCGKGFKFKNKLKLHERQHTGLMPYSCQNCDRSFRDWSNYAKHMKGMHNTDIRKRKRIIAKVPDELKQIKRPGRPGRPKNKEVVISKIDTMK